MDIRPAEAAEAASAGIFVAAAASSLPTLAERLRVLTLEAAGYEAAVEAATQALCTGADGLLCTLHRLGADGARLHLVGGFAAAALGGAGRIAALRAVALGIDEPLLGAAIAGARQRMLHDGALPDAQPHPLLAGAVRGPMTLIATPMRIAEERCVLLFGCPAPAPDLPELLGAVAAKLRPLLRMRREEERRALHRCVVAAASEALTGLAAADRVGRAPGLLQGLRPHSRERDAIGEALRQRLAGSEAAFRSLFERNPVPMWIHDAETLAFLGANDAATEDYGWTRAQFLTRTILDLHPAEDRAAARAAFAAFSGARDVSGPWRHLTASGGERIVETRRQRMAFAGRPAMLVSAQDITARTRCERELGLSRAALQRQAVELQQTRRLARLGTWRWDAASRRVAWSEEVHAMLGTDPRAPPPAGQAALDLVVAEDRAALVAALGRIMRSGRSAAFEFRVRRPDGRVVHCRGEGRWERDPDGGPDRIAGHVQDVTAQREAEAALRQADRLSALGQVTGGIAHDFNNLLTVASVSLEMAAEEARDGNAAPDLIEAARGALERGRRLTGQLLSYVRREPPRPEPLDLGEVLPGLVEMIQRTLGERYPIGLSLAPTPRILADPAQLGSALLNLMVNARDAMPAGGPIQVETSLVGPGAGDVAAVEAGKAGRYAMITVTDRGTGMPPALAARVFEPFFTTKAAGKGTGLGLSMVLGFAKQSGGRVTVSSEVGRGTCFALHLPLAAAGARVAERARPGEVAAPLPPGLEVLVVEDEPDVRGAAVRLCRQVGLRPVAVEGAAEALEMLGSGLRFDLLFTDIVLGGAMDGLELAAAALAIRPGLAVVCTSGHAAQQAAPRPPGAGGPERLSKPYDIRSFREALGRALAAAGAR